MEWRRGSHNLVTHWGSGAGNAAYSAGGWLYFNDGNLNTKSTSEDLDAVAHEFTHGIVETQAHIVDDSGAVDGPPALNEGLADVGAAMVDAHLNSNTPSAATWQISALNRNDPADGLRNLATPTYEDPYSRDWFPTRTFIVGVQKKQSYYRNSTILGQAFYLLAQNGVNHHYRAGLPMSEVPLINVTGLGYEAARNIFYYSLNTALVGPSSTFFDMRAATLGAALAGQQKTSVSQAWAAVGVGNNCSSAPATPQLQVWPYYCRGMYDINWPSVPGATKYDGQITQANLGWAFAATVVDANVNSCYQDLPNAYWMMRLRACNGCGCSGWSTTQYMQYYSPCL